MPVTARFDGGLTAFRQRFSTVLGMELISIRQVAEISGVSESTLRRQMERDGAAAPRRYCVSARAVRFDRQEVIEWLTATVEQPEAVLEDLPEHLRESRKRGPRKAA